MNAKLLAVGAVVALALVAVLMVATPVDAALSRTAAVQGGRVLGPKVNTKAKAPKSKAAAPAAKGGKDQKKKSDIRKKVRPSPIKGATPKTTKGKVKDEKGSAKFAKVHGPSNSGMGGVGMSMIRQENAAKAKAAAQRQANSPQATAKANAAKAAAAKGKTTASAKGKAKAKVAAKAKAPAAKKKGLPKFRAVLESADELDVAGTPPPAVTYPSKQADGSWKLSATYTLTADGLAAVTNALPKLASDKVFWHWDGFQSCTRWTRSGMSQGEMAFFDSSSDNMYAGGGLYMAEGFENSADYGMFPCRIVVKSGTPQYDESYMSPLVSARKIPSIPNTAEKVALGQVIPFVHQYARNAASRPPFADWWVTHSEQVFKEFSGGNTPLGDGTYVSPHFSNNAHGGNGNGQFAVNIQSSLDLYKYWNQLMDVDKLQPQLDVPAARDDLRGGLGWMKAFTFYMSYIDGASLFRALGVAPNDPFSVFEPDRFPNYQRVYEGYVNKRAASTTPSIFGWSASGSFGNGKDQAGIWAKNVLDNLLPGLYKELSAGGIMKFRDSEVRAGGDEEGRTFVATSGQVEVMKANPYLLTVDAPARADGSILVYYYYPDPLHRNPALKSRVSPALWAAMDEDIRLAGADFASFKQTDRYKQHTQALINELILEAFTRVWGKSAAMDAGGIQIMLDLVSIHPCTDFNGRTTRFVGVVGAIESNLEPPIAFMSDFDLTTPIAQYGAFLKSGTAAYLKLKLALTAELLTGVCNGRMPDHYHVSYWAKFATDALAPFAPAGSAVTVTYDSSDWDNIGHRRFVPLMDKKFGPKWIGRNSNKPITPVVQTPGAEPPVNVAPAPSQATPPPSNVPAAKADPNDCVNGKNSCSTCMRLSGKDTHGCGFHKDTHDCVGVYVVNNNNRDYVLLSGDCPRGSG